MTMRALGQDSFKTRRTLKVGGKSYDYFSLEAAAKALGDLSRLPYSLKVLLENLLRFEDGRSVKADDIKAMAAWLATRKSETEIGFRPRRFTSAAVNSTASWKPARASPCRPLPRRWEKPMPAGGAAGISPKPGPGPRSICTMRCASALPRNRPRAGVS